MNRAVFLFSFAAMLSLTVARAGPDTDGDGVADDVDNCIEHFNPDQIDTDDDGFGNRCDPDLNNDFAVNFADLPILKAAFFATPDVPEWNPEADFNGDDRINFGDLGIFQNFVFGPPGPSGDFCQPQAAGVVREDDTFAEPVPRVALRDAIADLQRTDPDAVFSFFNCEVDSFSTTPKDTIPDYARDVLMSLGLPVVPVTPERMLQPTDLPKPGQDLDSSASQIAMFPLLAEQTDPQPPPDGEPLDPLENDPSPTTPLEINRTRPPTFIEPPPDDYLPPDDDAQDRNAPAAMPILAAFLAEFGEVFRLPRDPSGMADISFLTGMQYSEGKFFRRLSFDGQMLGGLPVMDGRTLVQFDHNWNVINISRQLMTPGKLPIPAVQPIDVAVAESRARAAAETATGEPAGNWTIQLAQVVADPIRRRQLWQVDLFVLPTPALELTVLLDAQTGQVVNVSDNTLAYTDAKVRRWAYSGGNIGTGAFQVNSNGIYTRDDNTLEHDFFYMVTDERGGGAFGEFPCNQTPNTTFYRIFAYGTTSGTNGFIRHTHRTARDFNIWSPAASSGSFVEGHSYFWMRKFMLWVRPTLHHLGVLSNNVSNYKRFTLIINECSDNWYATSNYPIATQHNIGESLYKIRFREDCRSTNAFCEPDDYDDSGSSFVTCEGNGCATTPSVMHHEANHFIMSQYFGVGSGLDCGSGNQGKFLHEGTLGSVTPQAFWHFYYGVGFNPPDSNLFTKSSVRGRVHSDIATRLDLSDWYCVNNTDEPYKAGRVPGQPMWEIYHGKRADGNSLTNILRPSNDLTFLNLTYWAVDLVGASTWKDRYEMANRWMQLSINNLNFASAAQKATLRAQWCATWEHHELGTYINNAYCP